MTSRRDEDITQEVALPANVRPSRNAMTLHVIKGPRAGEVLTVDRDDAVLGRGEDADLRIQDPSLSRTHARFERDGDTLTVTDLESMNGTFVEGQRVRETLRLKSGEQLTLGNVVVRFAVQDPTELQVQRDLYEAAVRDRLTGLYNRGYFDDRLAAEWAFVKRHQSTMAVLVVDLDHFKSINDSHGHPVGDEVIRQTANKIRDSLRAEDLAARYGGEEFVVLARGTDAGGAQVLGQRLRTRIAQTDIEVPTGRVKVTASLGVAVMRRDLVFRSPGELMAAADAALYEAKHNGRNQVVVSAAALQGRRNEGSYSGSSQEEHTRPKR
ncbi:MAG TPA: GGDEF domain-containing protein [Polyangiales bacterium]|nr:GGDEF domain-containing protein [Polyangiales bacterium]